MHCELYGRLFSTAVATDWLTHAHVRVLQAYTISSVPRGQMEGIKPHGVGTGDWSRKMCEGPCLSAVTSSRRDRWPAAGHHQDRHMKIPLGESADFSMEGEKLFTTGVVHWLQSIFTAFLV